MEILGFMITTYTLKKEKVTKVSHEQIERHRFTWIRMLNPSYIEISDIAQITNVPEEEFVEFIEEDERPRFQQEESYLYIIYKLPSYEENTITTTPIGIIIKDNLIITIEKQPIRSIKYVLAMIEKNKSAFLFRKDPAFFLHYLFDKIDDEFLYITNKISQDANITGSIGFSKKKIEHLHHLNSTLIFIHQAMIANIEVLNSLRKLHFKNFGKIARNKFDELYYDGLQIQDTTKVQRELMVSMFDFQSTLASNNLNKIMRRITAVGFLLLLPTLIAGLYGMNFDYMPLQHNQYGFWIMLLIMFIITLGFVILFKKQDWL